MRLLLAEGIRKSYGPQEVLKDINIELLRGDMVALLGASGSGKSTLLHCLGLLDSVDAGRITFDGEDVTRLRADRACALRLAKLGFVFQFHHLIPELNAEENVVLPSEIMGKAKLAKARELLDWFGLASKIKRYPWELSGGEQQRIALARALINDPVLLLTDEVTGNLDRERAIEIMDILSRVNRDLGTCILSATHDLQLASYYRRQLQLTGGKAVLKTSGVAL